ncbi:hypothetical protein, partial [Chachezhania sediminis]|uniref:hypothetical protein n=1 Tax=Chachezhania sediminis TaxID=2599291 RepID=UPI001E64D283
WPARRKRRISPRRNRSEPPQTGQGPSCTAAIPERLTGKALARLSVIDILRSERVFFHRIGGFRKFAAVCTDGRCAQLKLPDQTTIEP